MTRRDPDIPQPEVARAVGDLIRAEGEREIARRCMDGREPMNSYDLERWAAAYDKTLEAQRIRLDAAIRALGWTIVAAVPLKTFRRAAERRAAQADR